MNEFDVLLGSWNVRERQRGAEGTWREWRSSSRFERQTDGSVLTEHYSSTYPDGQHVLGLAILAGDPATRTWSIAWLSNREPAPDFTPFTGSVTDGYGEFFQVTPDARFRWTWELDPRAPRWTQAVSRDDGATWDVSWSQDFTRAD